MTEIITVKARQILDSRGNPTVEAEVYTQAGGFGRASVPSGASTGIHEAIELRDGGVEYSGLSVEKAVCHILGPIAKAIIGQNVFQQAEIDKQMISLDGTTNKSKFGANAILAVSLAVARAACAEKNLDFFQYLKPESATLLPMPLMNILNGGAHANNQLEFQEFMIIPVGANSFKESLRFGVEVFHALKSTLAQAGFSTAVGDEGGFAPNFKTQRQAIEAILEAITLAGFQPGLQVALGLDVASSEFYKSGLYHLGSEGKYYESSDFIEYLAQLVEDYPIISIEDGLSEDDWSGWQALTEKLGDLTQLVGDDLFVTNPRILEKGIQENVANAILIKPNQIGTLTETLEAIQLAKKAHYGVILSHRSGETEDTSISDLAVGLNAGQIKTGSLCRTDRVAKYNQLLRIEESLGAHATFNPKVIFSPKTGSDRE